MISPELDFSWFSIVIDKVIEGRYASLVSKEWLEYVVPLTGMDARHNRASAFPTLVHHEPQCIVNSDGVPFFWWVAFGE